MTALRILIALVLLATGVGKALDLRGFTEVIATYRVLPSALLWPAALGMVVVELGLAGWLLSGRRCARAALSAAALHGVFIVWISVALLRGLTIPNCGCFGVFWARPLTGWTVLEDLIMLALCLLLYGLAARKARPQSVSSPSSRSTSRDGERPARLSNASR